MEVQRESWEVWNRILEKGARFGTSSLSEAERRIFHLNKFLCDYENGGWLYNLSPSDGGNACPDLEATIAAVHSVGRTELAQVLQAVYEIVAADVDDNSTTWEGFLVARDPDGEMAGLEKRLTSLYADLWDDLEQITASFVGEGSGVG